MKGIPKRNKIKICSFRKQNNPLISSFSIITIHKGKGIPKQNRARALRLYRVHTELIL